jgi:PPOX class probable F420-dependent enzyme
MASITDPEVLGFLTNHLDTGKIGYTKADGQVVIRPIWFIVDGGDIVFMTGRNSVKAKAFRRDPRVAFSLDKVSQPMSSVQIEGTVAESFDDKDRVLPLIIRRYVPASQVAGAEATFRGIPDETVYRLRPVKVHAAINSGLEFGL